jgi:hypothetical protein
MNREDGFCLIKSSKLLICSLKEISIREFCSWFGQSPCNLPLLGPLLPSPSTVFTDILSHMITAHTLLLSHPPWFSVYHMPIASFLCIPILALQRSNPGSYWFAKSRSLLLAVLFLGLYFNPEHKPLWYSGQSSWLQIQRPGIDSRQPPPKKSSGPGTGSTQPREFN